MSLPWDRYGAEPELPYVPPVPVTVPPEPVSPPPPPPPPAPPPPVDVSGTPDPSKDTATDLVKADAASRSKRTLIQGLIFDVFAAVVASVALLAGADPFVKETWIGFGILLIKSVVSAGISYFMRLKNTPTARTRGEKYTIEPLPQPITEEERKRS